jgi:PAS domain-containing protein
MLTRFPNTDIEFFFSESREDGKYIFESDKFAQIDGRSKAELSKLVVKDIRSDRVPRYVLDEMYHWSRSKGFWSGILENIRGDGSTYWVNASIIKVSSNIGYTKYGMISVPASADEISIAKENFDILKNITFDKRLGLTKLLYPLNN